MKKDVNPRGAGCLVLLYITAAPVYLLRLLLWVVHTRRLWRISRLGYVECPHCRAENAIDILASCPRCKTTEYGNRLRCSGCGSRAEGFPCDACGVTIRCF